MIDITRKVRTHRKATAQAIVNVSMKETIEAVLNKKVPKGDVFEASRVAGLFAVKRTSDMIPDCHPLPIEHAAVTQRIEGLSIIIETEVHSIYRTGVEVEAMHGASIAALTIYDMLKPIDKGIEITGIKLLGKKGGRSQYTEKQERVLTSAVIVCSDSVSKGEKEDTAGKAVIDKLKDSGVEVKDYIIIPDETDLIRDRIRGFVEENIDIIALTGGTGLSPRDVTHEAVKPMLEREIPGISEAMRSHGQEITPYAMLSRSIAGLIGKSLILALPGSTKGARESMDSVFPYLLHIFRIMDSLPHTE
jgi:cyclic pyranopterin phosphate synthase